MDYPSLYKPVTHIATVKTNSPNLYKHSKSWVKITHAYFSELAKVILQKVINEENNLNDLQSS